MKTPIKTTMTLEHLETALKFPWDTTVCIMAQVFEGRDKVEASCATSVHFKGGAGIVVLNKYRPLLDTIVNAFDKYSCNENGFEYYQKPETLEQIKSYLPFEFEYFEVEAGESIIQAVQEEHEQPKS